MQRGRRVNKQQVKSSERAIFAKSTIKKYVAGGMTKQAANIKFDRIHKHKFTVQGKWKDRSLINLRNTSNKPTYRVTTKGPIRRNFKNGGDKKQLGLYDLLYEENEIEKGSKTQDDIPRGTVVSPLDIISQVPNTKIEVAMDIDALTAVAAVWPLYCLHNGVGVNEVVNVPGTGPVGKIWFMAVTLAYDLWVASGNNWSIFSKFPEVYGDLRAALMPTNIPGYQYNFLTPQTFFGGTGLYPGGFPLAVDNVSISWIGAFIGAQFPMNNIVPVLSEQQIIDFGPDNCTELWTKIIESKNSKHSWVNVGAENIYLNRTEAFAMVRVANDDPNNNRWCNYQLETKLAYGARWLAYLGLAAQNPNVPRAGAFIIANYQSASNYAHRVVNGIVGMLGHDIIVRFKLIDIETIVQNFVITMVAADLQYNDVAGERQINQAILPRSVVGNIDPGQVLHSIVTLVARRFGLLNFVGFDNPVVNSFVLAGAQYMVGVNDLTNRVWTWMAESFAGLQRLERQVSSTTAFAEYPLVVAYGTFGNNGFASMANQANLLPLMDVMYPNQGTLSYSWRVPSISGLTHTIDPANMTLSFTEGEDMQAALEWMANQIGSLQGNVNCSVATNKVHKKSTFMYLTRMLVPVESLVHRKRFKKKIKEYYGEDECREIEVTPVSPIYTSTISEIRSRYDFNIDNITWCLTRILPSSFLNPTDYSAIYNEKISSPSERGTTESYSTTYVKSIVSISHPIAGDGDEQSKIDNKRIEMGVGGGFWSGIGNFFDNLFGM